MDRILLGFDMSNKQQEKIALGTSILILMIAAWFWSGQIADVVETLTLAYG